MLLSNRIGERSQSVDEIEGASLFASGGVHPSIRVTWLSELPSAIMVELLKGEEEDEPGQTHMSSHPTSKTFFYGHAPAHICACCRYMQCTSR
jgi:hypothetical protein